MQSKKRASESIRRTLAASIKLLLQNTGEVLHIMLGTFDELFEVMGAADRRKLMEMFIAEVQLHPKDTWKMG